MKMHVNTPGWLMIEGFNVFPNVIELGGGSNPQFQPNVDTRWCRDLEGRPTVAFTADFDRPLPIKSEEWDVVFCRYAIEHISWRNVDQFVSEILRILKPGGQVFIVTANAEAQMRWALAQTDWAFDRISQCLGGDQDHPDNTHKVFFNPISIERLFSCGGFEGVLVLKHGELGTDMIVEARKPVSPLK